jgi:NAD-dependent SIR2 family protein deacetylase
VVKREESKVDQGIIQQAARWIGDSVAVIITSGAGMGVDSGLPDFRGDTGFWKAYPMYKKLNINFMEAANPVHFATKPEFGWGFYGHRLKLYRNTTPNKGFYLLQKWIIKLKLDYFVVTSNVDGQFQASAFNKSKVYEVHGSIHHLQCSLPCQKKIWFNNTKIEVEESTASAINMPYCDSCGCVARPNILMFGDSTWISSRSYDQDQRFQNFLNENRGKQKVIIEIGAGTAIPTIRYLSEKLGDDDARVIRINPRESAIEYPHFSLPMGCVAALELLDKELENSLF